MNSTCWVAKLTFTSFKQKGSKGKLRWQQHQSCRYIMFTQRQNAQISSPPPTNPCVLLVKPHQRQQYEKRLRFCIGDTNSHISPRLHLWQPTLLVARWSIHSYNFRGFIYDLVAEHSYIFFTEEWSISIVILAPLFKTFVLLFSALLDCLFDTHVYIKDFVCVCSFGGPKSILPYYSSEAHSLSRE